MPVLVGIALIGLLYLGAVVLIPVLEALLKLFVLLGALAPFLLFIGIGVLIGWLLSEDKCKL
jgi:hypothetical protein